MKTRTKRLLFYIFLSACVFFLGDIISPISNLITQLKSNIFEKEIVEQAHSREKKENTDEKLKWRFISQEEVFAILFEYEFSEKEAVDFVDYVRTHARKANFVPPEVKEELLKEQYSFGLPNAANGGWAGTVFFNDKETLKIFPPYLFRKAEYFPDNPNQSVYYYFTPEDFCNYLVYSGFPPKEAAAFEKKLRRPPFPADSKHYGIIDQTLPEPVKRVMGMMHFSYSISVTNGVWNGIINIDRNGTYYTVGISNLCAYTDFFHFETTEPFDVGGIQLYYFLWDKNWAIFKGSFFNPQGSNQFFARETLYDCYSTEKLMENPYLDEKVKSLMQKGNYMFSEPYLAETKQWLGIRNVMIDDTFYLFLKK